MQLRACSNRATLPYLGESRRTGAPRVHEACALVAAMICVFYSLCTPAPVGVSLARRGTGRGNCSRVAQRVGTAHAPRALDASHAGRNHATATTSDVTCPERSQLCADVCAPGRCVHAEARTCYELRSKDRTAALKKLLLNAACTLKHHDSTHHLSMLRACLDAGVPTWRAQPGSRARQHVPAAH